MGALLEKTPSTGHRDENHIRPWEETQIPHETGGLGLTPSRWEFPFRVDGDLLDGVGRWPSQPSRSAVRVPAL